MIRPTLRIASALVGLLLISVAGFSHLDTGSFVCGFMGGLLMLPLCATWRAPRVEELDTLSEWVARLRTAMIGCYAFALWLYIVVAATNRSMSYMAIQRMASLGSAFWVVGFVVMFFTAYYASRRSALLRTLGE